MSVKYWGYHLSLNCKACDIESIKSYDNIYDFVKQLVKDIDMVPYGEPQIVHFGSDDKSGYTLNQLIETSNITAHFVDQNGNAYIDVFSCKNYSINTVISLVEKYFKPTRVKSSFQVRDADKD